MDDNLNNALSTSNTIIEGLEIGDLTKNQVVNLLNDIKEEVEIAKSQLV